MMNHNWNTEDIIEHFTLLPPEISFLGSSDPHNHLGKTLLLKFFQKEGRFPEDVTELPAEIVAYVAQQLDLPPEVIHNYDWNGRRHREHRRDIRELLGYFCISPQKGIFLTNQKGKYAGPIHQFPTQSSRSHQKQEYSLGLT